MASAKKSRIDKLALEDKRLALKVRLRLLKACAREPVTRDKAVRSAPKNQAWACPSLPFLYQG
jgi:hypothetical protein